MISTAVRVSFGHDGMRMSSTIASISFNRRLVSWLKENVLRNFSYVCFSVYENFSKMSTNNIINEL